MNDSPKKGDSPHLPERPEGCCAQMGTVPFFPTPIAEEFWPLLDAACADELTAEQWAELQSHLESSPAARRAFIDHIRLRTHIRQWWKGERSREAGLSRIEMDFDDEGRGMAGSPAIDVSVGAAVQLPRQPKHQPGREILGSEPLVPPVIILSPSPSLSTIHYPLSTNFVGGPVFSYMVATVILGMMLLGAWAYKITHYQQIAEAPSVTSNARPALVFVGRITGMVDCRWADPQTEAYAWASVPLGRKYALASGLMEITYKTGAKVILQGPCTYEVESRRGGYLALGKVTARIEERGEKREERAKPQAANPKSQIPNLQISNPQSLIPNPLFAIRTPTVIVTDLGTEFGVEVSENGATESHVIQGKVDVKILDPIGCENKHVSIGEGQAVCIKPERKKIDHVAFAADRFVRRFSSPPDTRAEEAYIQAVLADKPLGYWPLNEPAYSRKFLDRSGNNFHGVALGEVLAGKDGPLPGQSRAIELKQNGYIDVGRQDRFALENNFTVEAWVWIDPELGDFPAIEPGPIISAGSGEARYQQSGWHLSCRPRVRVEVGGDNKQRICTLGSYGVNNSPILDIPMPLSQWAHVAFVFRPDNTAQAYINGRASAILKDCTPPKPGPAWVGIGWHSNLGGEYWRGRLAHVAVYPRALDERQIFNHYRIYKENPVDGKEEH